MAWLLPVMICLIFSWTVSFIEVLRFPDETDILKNMLLENTESNFQEERNDREQLNSTKKNLIVAVAPT